MFSKKLDIYRCLFFFLVPLLLISCSKSRDPQETDVNFLGHKGAGSNNYNDRNMENTLAAVQEGIQVLDGVELDIQMSLDGTPWIFHDTEGVNDLNCSGDSAVARIPTMHDSEIEQIFLCHRAKKDRLYKLAEVIDLLNASTTGFYISLDVKISFPAEMFQQIGGRDAYLLRLADSLASVIKVKDPEKILVEIDSKLFCDRLKSYPTTSKVQTFFMRYEDIDRKIANAIKLGYDGISCNFTDKTVTAEKIKEARDKGLAVQLWTPYYREELLETLSWKPDFIQTDNIRAKTGLNLK